MKFIINRNYYRKTNIFFIISGLLINILVILSVTLLLIYTEKKGLALYILRFGPIYGWFVGILGLFFYKQEKNRGYNRKWLAIFYLTILVISCILTCIAIVLR